MNEEERDLEAELKEEKDRFEAQNQEAYDKEVSGENEIKAAYEKNRERLRKTREESADPDRFQSQLETIQKYTPDPMNPREVSEFFTDMAIDASILSKTATPQDLATGISAIIARRLTKNPSLKKIIKESTGLGIESTPKLPDESNIGLSLVQRIGKAIDQTGITGPFKVGFRGDLIGAVSDGVGTVGSNQTFQLVTQFPWEYNSKAVARPKANYGDTISITNRRVPRGKTGRMTTRKLNQFTKVEELDLSNGFIATKQHANFREYIEDLIEADKIPAQNIAPSLFKAKQYKKTPDLELYEDYLAGYFNTYDTLEGATKVTLGPSATTGKIQYFFPANDIPKVDRIMKIFKLNPEAFRNATASAGVINSKQFLQDISKHPNINTFLAKQFKFQGHHLAIIDDSFALVKGLNAKDTITMRNYMKSIDMPLGNDPKNIKFIPRKLHQKFMHGKIWKEFGPIWTGTSKLSRKRQLELSKLPVEERFKFADELKEALEVTNVVADRAVNNYIISKGTNVPPTAKQWDDYMGELITDDLMDLPPTGTANEPGFEKLGGGQDLRPATEIESGIFGQGQMQDDL